MVLPCLLGRTCGGRRRSSLGPLGGSVAALGRRSVQSVAKSELVCLCVFHDVAIPTCLTDRAGDHTQQRSSSTRTASRARGPASR